MIEWRFLISEWAHGRQVDVDGQRVPVVLCSEHTGHQLTDESCELWEQVAFCPTCSALTQAQSPELVNRRPGWPVGLENLST